MTPPKARQSKAPDERPVANLSHEDKISWLVHQHEGLQDWRVTVDERLATTEAATEELSRKVSTIEATTKRLEDGQADVKALTQQVLIVVQGQQIKGLETPGVAERITKVEALAAAHDKFVLRVQIALGVAAGLLSLGAWRVAPYLTQILAILK